MSFQQTTPNAEGSHPSRASSNAYNHPHSRVQQESQGQGAPFPQGQPASTPHDSLSMNAIMNQFASLTLPPVTASNAQFYMTQDGQIFCGPAPGMYPPQPLAPGQLADGSYGFPAAMPYLAQTAYGYVPGYSMLPYTPGRAGYYPDRSEYVHKEVPGLENRRSSYSTNESVPGTPYYVPTSLRDQSTQIAPADRSPFGSTPSPQQFALPQPQHGGKSLSYKAIPVDVDISALILQHPAIPRAVPAVFTPRESMRTLDQSLSNPIYGNRNVYIRGLHPQTDDSTLAAYAARFGKVETSKAIIDTSTGACKGFGFAKYYNLRDSELCIRGFYQLGYEVGFARVLRLRATNRRLVTNAWQESFNSRLKAEGDETSTNLYVSNLPKNMTESELGAIFMDYTVSSSRILRDPSNNSRGVGFARFESREICDEIIRKFHGQPIGEEGLLLQVRYADTPAQKDLKRVTSERRQFRTNEYNVGAYGGSTATVLPLAPPLAVASPIVPRASQIARHLPSRVSGSWKRETHVHNYGMSFKDVDRKASKVSFKELNSSNTKPQKASVSTPTISEDGSGEDVVTVHCDSPAVVHGASASVPSAFRG